jgi:hypothetical protein
MHRKTETDSAPNATPVHTTATGHAPEIVSPRREHLIPNEDPGPSEYTLLARALNGASEAERACLREILEETANGTELPRAALHLAARAFKVKLLADSIEENADLISELTAICIKKGWLHEFIAELFLWNREARNHQKDLTPDEAIRILADQLREFETRLSTARSLLSEYPAQFTKAIRAAVIAHPEILK